MRLPLQQTNKRSRVYPMKVETILYKKNINVEGVARKATTDGKILAELMAGLTCKKEIIRENSSKVLKYVSTNNPRLLYPDWWNFLGDMLNHENTYHKLSAVVLLSNLTLIDNENRFEKIFNTYYGLLNDKSMITAAWVAGNSGKIARAKPKLQSRITGRLLAIDKTHHQPQRIDLIKSYILEAFDEYFSVSSDQSRMIKFAQKQLNCLSSRTRKEAQKFLNKWTL
jgi:hypothetical protein